jgi:hypothetical protein
MRIFLSHHKAWSFELAPRGKEERKEGRWHLLLGASSQSGREWTPMKTMWAVVVYHNLLIWVALYPFQNSFQAMGSGKAATEYNFSWYKCPRTSHTAWDIPGLPITCL